MGRVFGNTQTGKSKKGRIDWGSSGSSISSGTYQGFQSSDLETLAQEAGLNPPKKEVGVLPRLLGLLASSETAPAVYKALETGSIGQGALEYGKELGKGITLQGLDPEKKNYSDVLKLIGMPEGKIAGPISARNALGLLMDIGLDPGNYVGGALLKKVASPIVKKTVGAVGKTKIGGAIGETVSDILGGLFEKGYKVKKLGPEGKAFLELTDKLQKGTRADALAKIDEIKKLAADTTLKYGPKAGETISEVVETGVKTGFKDIDDIADTIALRSKEMAKTESGVKLLKSEVANYIRHYITPEAREYLAKYGPGSVNASLTKFKVAKGFAKKRNIAGTISEINEEFMKKNGINLFEPDAFKAWAGREVEHVKAIKMDSFLKEVEERFGQKGSNAVVIDGMKWVPYQPQGSLKFYKGTFKPGEDIMKQIGYQLYDNPISMPQLLEQSFTKTGKAMEFAEQSGLKVGKLKGGKALGRATIGGVEKGGILDLRAFNSHTITHELGHAFDTKLSKVINSSRDYQKELKELVKWTGLGGSETYRSKATERFAEFISAYIHNPSKVKEFAPKFTAYFEKNMLPSPKIKGLVDKLGTFFQKVNGLPNIKSKLAEMGGNKYIKKAVMTAFPEKSYVGVSKNVKTFLLPEPIAQFMNDSFKVMSNDDALDKFIKSYDYVLNLWKKSVTGIFPAFHARNAMGGMFNNYIAGLPFADVRPYIEGSKIASGQVGEIVTKAGTKISYDDIRKAMSQLGVSGQSGSMDVFKNIDEVVGEIGQSGLKKVWNTATDKIPQKTMGFIEDRLRTPLFVDTLKKGGTFEDAAKKVFQFHFDYAPEAFTPFERKYMKRLIPFYTWTKNNIPLQLSQMVAQPEKYSRITKMLRSLRGDTTGEEIAALPQYMREQFPIGLGGDGENKSYSYGLGLPMEEVGEVFGESPQRTAEKLAGKLTPVFKIPFEYASGKNFYMGQPIKELNYVPSYIAKAPFMDKLLGIREETSRQGKKYYVTSRPELLYGLTTALGRLGTTIGKIDSDDMSFISKILYGAAGIKTRGVNIEKEKSYRESERRKVIEDFLEREGILKKFERYYQPKE